MDTDRPPGECSASKPLSAVEIAPCWAVAPVGRRVDGKISIVIEPGAGFGDGTHETTKLCLQAIAALAPRGAGAWRMLDFGSGSGILAIGAANLGAWVDAVDIDELAIRHAERNARINGVSDRIGFSRTLAAAPGPFEMIVGNILRPVLLEFAAELCFRLGDAGALMLSGLVSTDLPAVSARYAALLGRQRPEIYERGDWRGLLWRSATPSSRS